MTEQPELVPAHRQVLDADHIHWQGHANNTTVSRLVSDPDLVLYVQPVHTTTWYRVCLIDAAGRVYAQEAQYIGWPVVDSEPAPSGLVAWLLLQVTVDEQAAHGTMADGDLARALAECDTKREIIQTCANMLWEHEGGPDVVAATTLNAYADLYLQLGRTGFQEEWRQ
jgi:hypothetical protein